MVELIKRQVFETLAETGRDHLHDEVIAAMASVPRHQFVDASQRADAYRDCPLPIGFGQTISQPFIVALMTDLLDANRSSKILEIGTGSGYQAAILSLLADRVYTIESVPELAARAKRDLARLGYHNVQVKAGNGREGWPEQAPFDGIMVTAGGELPPALANQLKPGGRIVIPLGPPRGTQNLTVLEKNAAGELQETAVLPVRFVPLTDSQ